MASVKLDWSAFRKASYCINLIEREDRYLAVRTELERVGLLDETEFYRASRSKISGAVGCYTSHVNVLRAARARGLDYVLVLEDDLYFDTERLRQFLPRINHYIESHRGDTTWDILYLGHLPLAFGKIVYKLDDFTVRETSSLHLHCYIANLRSPALNEFIDRPIPTKDVEVIGCGSTLHIDLQFRSLLPHCQAISPMVAFQNSALKSDNNWGVIAELFRPGNGSARELELTTQMVTVPKLALNSSVVSYSMHAVNKLVFCNSVARKFTGWIPIAVDHLDKYTMHFIQASRGNLGL
jgi:hypothetical protein